MKAVKFHKKNKNHLKELGGKYDDVVSQLISKVGESMPIVDIDYSPVSTIKLSEDTICKLESFKLTEGESLENVIVRMLIAQSLYSAND